jgi:hypothetical protein
MQSNFVIWAQDIVKGACTLSSMSGFEDRWRLYAGVPLADVFPGGGRLQMDPDNPTGIKLTDSLYNMNDLVVASTRLCTLLQQAEVDKVEYLPVPVFNHKNRAVEQAYCVVNLLEQVDCLVIDACKPRWSKMDNTNIDRMQQFVIDESRIAAGRTLFRPKFFKYAILAHRSLAQKIDAAGITGIRWIELSDYPEE